MNPLTQIRPPGWEKKTWEEKCPPELRLWWAVLRQAAVDGDDGFVRSPFACAVMRCFGIPLPEAMNESD